jgi:hypothetical protein
VNLAWFDWAWIVGMGGSLLALWILGHRAIYQVRMSQGNHARMKARIERMTYDVSAIGGDGCERPTVRN